MNLLVIIFVIFSAWKWSDWKNWQKYHATMLFIVVANLLYNLIYYDHLLWKLMPDFLYSQFIGELLYTFIVFPFTALLFMSRYPKSIKSQIFYNLKYIAIYILFEFIFYKFGGIIYNYDWNMWWSLAWDCMMFPIWALHYKKPLLAYGASIIVIIAVLMLFPLS